MFTLHVVNYHLCYFYISLICGEYLVNVHFDDIPHSFILHFTLHSAEKIGIKFSANYPLTTFRILQNTPSPLRRSLSQCNWKISLILGCLTVDKDSICLSRILKNRDVAKFYKKGVILKDDGSDDGTARALSGMVGVVFHPCGWKIASVCHFCQSTATDKRKLILYSIPANINSPDGDTQAYYCTN